jgi:polar amino acid transport system permease protein
MPPLLNDFVALQKETALVVAVGLFDALGTASDTANFIFNFTPYVVAAAFFVALTVPMARYTDWLAARYARRERAGAR